jgi:radical SAM family uncharacterized protein
VDGLKDILKRVQKPARYIGGETNSVRKSFTSGRISVALAYPDIYEVGMSYLGLRILYHLLSERDDIVCERVFAPWNDMEEELKKSGRKLFSLESKRDIDRFDIVGFSLSYELTFTNVLNMLHLSGITIESSHRREEEPLVIAGGACCYNPEPMSKFIDVFLIGDAEESILTFIDEYKTLKKKSLSRKEMLRSLALLPGVYVPSLYKAEYNEDTFKGLSPVEEGIPSRIKKSFVSDFENAYYPEKQIVPFIRIIHDRIAVEIMRGCPNMCRFCQASSINRPVRLRSPERVRRICGNTYRNTGSEQIALLSLSSVNYPGLAELVNDLNEDFREKGVGVSIPSLRVDEKFYELPEMISSVRKSGLTFAPESMDDGLRRSIGKAVDLEVLCRSALLAYRNGWKKLKLYFMVGFPRKTDQEAERIINLARDLSFLKKKASGGAAEITVSVNAFTPKPHTPFQWMGMQNRQELVSIRKELISGSRGKVKVDFHDIDKSMLEACFSRGDRRVSDVIFSAWRRGARMDGWAEFFDLDKWRTSFLENGLDMQQIACKKYALDDMLPWSHIYTGVSNESLKREISASGLYDACSLTF